MRTAHGGVADPSTTLRTHWRALLNTGSQGGGQAALLWVLHLQTWVVLALSLAHLCFLIEGTKSGAHFCHLCGWVTFCWVCTNHVSLTLYTLSDSAIGLGSCGHFCDEAPPFDWLEVTVTLMSFPSSGLSLLHGTSGRMSTAVMPPGPLCKVCWGPRRSGCVDAPRQRPVGGR